MTVGTIQGRTTNYAFALISPNARSWADEQHANWVIADTVLFATSGLSGILGIWTVSTAFIVGDRVIDTDGKVYQTLIAHTSGTSTFAADRIANPNDWDQILNAPVSRGVWATGIKYNANDFVLDSSRYAVCNTTHTSTTSFDTDIAFWDVLLDFDPFIGNFTLQNGSTFVLEGSGSPDASLDDAGLDKNDAGAVTYVFQNSGAGTITVHSDNYSVATAIVHTGDVDNLIGFGPDTQSFETGGTARINISDTGLQVGSGARVTTILDEDDLTSDDATALVTQQSIKAYVDLKAPLASPVLTGDPTAPTATPGDDDVSIATTAFVTAAITAGKADVDVQNVTGGTWTRPTGDYEWVLVDCVGGGGGGGSGRRDNTGNENDGGGGGAPGGRTIMLLRYSEISGNETVTIGAGGTGGAAITTSPVNGLPGVVGGDTTFGKLVTANGGDFGNGGAAGGGTGGANSTFIDGSHTPGSGGGIGNDTVAGGAGGTNRALGGGGGGGGGAQGGDFAGGAGGATGKIGGTDNAGGTGGATGVNGGNGTAAYLLYSGLGTGGGGGGGENVGGGATGGDGGVGGAPGGGGGGGGSADDGNSGAGGIGGAGRCTVYTF